MTRCERPFPPCPPIRLPADLNAVADYVTKLPAANGRLMVGGFSWGGGQAFRMATNNKLVNGTFVFYGTAPEKAEDLARITCPIYGFYAGNDARITATVPDTEKRMKEAGKAYDPAIYDGAGHGFMRAGEAPDANEANKKAHDEAWKRWKRSSAQVERGVGGGWFDTRNPFLSGARSREPR